MTPWWFLGPTDLICIIFLFDQTILSTVSSIHGPLRLTYLEVQVSDVFDAPSAGQSHFALYVRRHRGSYTHLTLTSPTGLVLAITVILFSLGDMTLFLYLCGATVTTDGLLLCRIKE